MAEISCNKVHILFEMLSTIWYHFYNLKNLKNTMEERQVAGRSLQLY